MSDATMILCTAFYLKQVHKIIDNHTYIKCDYKMEYEIESEIQSDEPINSLLAHAS